MKSNIRFPILIESTYILSITEPIISYSLLFIAPSNVFFDSVLPLNFILDILSSPRQQLFIRLFLPYARILENDEEFKKNS